MAMPKERKTLNFRGPLETNHVKHLKESITEFKIMITCMLEAFLHHHTSTELTTALVESVSKWLSLDLGLN